MAVAINVAGLATIKIALSGGALQTLGYTRDGAQVVTEGHTLNVPGDENGGDAGPPIDIQYMGETARIRLEMTKYDITVADAIAARLSGGTVGVPGTAGTLLFAGSKTIRLLVHSPANPMNFPRATLASKPIEINKGTKFSTLIMEFDAYKDANGVLMNQTTT